MFNIFHFELFDFIYFTYSDFDITPSNLYKDFEKNKYDKKNLSQSELTNNCNSKAGSNKSYKKKCYQSLLRKKPECEGQTTFFGKFDFEKTKKCLKTDSLVLVPNH